MDREEKTYDLFETEKERTATTKNTDRTHLKKFDFDDILDQAEAKAQTVEKSQKVEKPRTAARSAPAEKTQWEEVEDKPRKKKKKAYEELDLDGNPVTGTEEQKKKIYRRDRRRAAGSLLAGIFSWIKELAIALVIVWFVITFVAQNNRVIGTSMQPTVYANDMVIVNKFIYRFTAPVRGDVIVFPSVENGEKVFLIKRIIGLPGDVVDLQDGKVIVNDKELVEKYIAVETTPVSGQVTFPVTVPEGCYFVLGDNRIVSKDSRYRSIGMIP
ncbi:MAG: signal peptidase I, partial [Clostridiales bacterium]|nr:signal peptidase I [Clostridiales bacterium]